MTTTPKQLMQTAMNLGTPERVPLMCQMSIGHMLLQLQVSPAEFWFDPVVFAEGLLRLREMYSFDGILISLHGHDPDWRQNVKGRRLTEEGEEVVWHNGDRTLCLYEDLPEQRPAQEAALPLLAELREEDLPTTLNYIPVSQGLYFHLTPGHTFDIFTNLVGRAGREFSIHGEITSPFDYLLHHFGMQEALLGLIDQPDKARMFLAHFTRLITDLAVKMCDTGIDALKVSSPFAGAGFISPAFYSEFVLPFEREIIAAVRQKQVPIYLHTCGAIGDRLPLMIASGTSGLECLDPPPLGNVELAEARKLTLGRCFIKGNIDSVNTLLPGRPEEILADARQRLEIGREGGGFILSTACSIAPGVKRESILLLREAVEKWG